MVDLPQPLAPTNAANCPAGITKLTCFKIIKSGRRGYANDTFRNSILPMLRLSGFKPSVDSGSISDFWSMTANTASLAASALACATHRRKHACMHAGDR